MSKRVDAEKEKKNRHQFSSGEARAGLKKALTFNLNHRQRNIEDFASANNSFETAGTDWQDSRYMHVQRDLAEIFPSKCDDSV